jgi:hypothetical protein
MTETGLDQDINCRLVGPAPINNFRHSESLHNAVAVPWRRDPRPVRGRRQAVPQAVTQAVPLAVTQAQGLLQALLVPLFAALLFKWP